MDDALVLERLTPDDHGKYIEQLGLFRIELAKDRDALRRRHYWLSRAEMETRLPSFEYGVFATPRYAEVLVVDVDDKVSPATGERGGLRPGPLAAKVEQLAALLRGLPIPPNVAGLNLANERGSFQLTWYLDRPVFAVGAERAAFKAVKRGLNALLGGDEHHTTFSRNPTWRNGQNDVGYRHYVVDHGMNSLEDLATTYGHEESGAEVVASLALSAKGPDPATGIYVPRGTQSPILQRYDQDGLQRKKYLTDAAIRHAGSVRFRGEDVRAEVLLPFLFATARAINDGRAPVSADVVRRIAERSARYANENFVPGRGCDGAKRYTRDQRRRGGVTQGRANVESGHWADVRRLGPMAVMVNAVERHAAIRDLYESGVRSKAEIARQLGVSRPTVYAALRELECVKN